MWQVQFGLCVNIGAVFDWKAPKLSKPLITKLNQTCFGTETRKKDENRHTTFILSKDFMQSVLGEYRECVVS